MQHEYTTNDFNDFKTYVISWLNKFGITEWEIDFKHHQIDSAARTTYDNKSKLACFQLNKNIEYDYCAQLDIGKLALHEVLHLLLADLGYTINETKDYCSDLAIAQEHAVVMRLMRVIA